MTKRVRGDKRSGRTSDRQAAAKRRPAGEYIEGRRAATEALRAGFPVKRALVAEGEGKDAALAQLVAYLHAAGVPVITRPRAELDALSAHGAHQGIALEVGAFPYAELTDIVARAGEGPALVVVLDHVTDAGNFGAIVRSAEVVGAAGVVIASKRAAEVNVGAYKTSAGAVMHLPIARVPNTFLAKSKLLNSSRFMKSFGEGNYQVPEAPRKYQEDEIGLLYKNFDSMVEKIQTLIQENYVNEILKKEAQLKAMESQMDPHFLYNTLESINWRAKMIKSEEISQITTALGSLLRFSLGKNSEDFTLDQEMQIVNNYITIQKIRYQRRLDFSADVPSDLLGVFIPKFTIQPLLENAIRYGLEESSETCYISIVCREVLGLLIIRITNTGSSFEENCMEKLQSGEIQPHGFGIGILNIHRRLQLTYGEPYGLLLYNIEDEETYEECAVAEIRIPCKKKE